jgi:hypothetical protein
MSRTGQGGGTLCGSLRKINTNAIICPVAVRANCVAMRDE